ncbi:hypothetical protein ABK040_002740 [Willaertia magna]
MIQYYLLELPDELIFTISFFLTDPHYFELTCSRIRKIIYSSWKEKFQQQQLLLTTNTCSLYNINESVICFISPNEYLQKLLKQQEKLKDLSLQNNLLIDNKNNKNNYTLDSSSSNINSCYKIAFYYTKWLQDFKKSHFNGCLQFDGNPLDHLILKSYYYSPLQNTLQNNNKEYNLFKKEKYPEKLLINGLNCKLFFDEKKIKEVELREENRLQIVKQEERIVKERREWRYLCIIVIFCLICCPCYVLFVICCDCIKNKRNREKYEEV